MKNIFKYLFGKTTEEPVETNGPKGGNPSDLETLIRKSQERLKKVEKAVSAGTLSSKNLETGMQKVSKPSVSQKTQMDDDYWYSTNLTPIDPKVVSKNRQTATEILTAMRRFEEQHQKQMEVMKQKELKDMIDTITQTQKDQFEEVISKPVVYTRNKTEFAADDIDNIYAAKATIQGYLNMRSTRLLEEAEAFIAGGMIESVFHGQIPRDIDIFVLDINDSYRRAAEFINDLISSKGFEDLKSDPYTKKTMRPWIHNVFTLKDVRTDNVPRVTLQIIFTKLETREEVIQTFDYLHATPSYEIGKDKLNITVEAYNAITSKTLVVNNRENCTEEREKKMLDRGWRKESDVIHEQIMKERAMKIGVSEEMYKKLIHQAYT